MSDETITKHIERLHNSTLVEKDTLVSFLEKFKVLGDLGINANSMFYILNLNTMTYEYINDACESFTGFQQQDFMTLGMGILPKIIDAEDLVILSETLFPRMNDLTQTLTAEEKSKIVFELHYKMIHKNTGVITQMVEYSSYSKFDADGTPLLSTGICYPSNEVTSKVKGIVRVNEGNQQRTLFQEEYSVTKSCLTQTEYNIASLLRKGYSRKEIASHNNVSMHTVSTHIKNMYKKMGVNKVAELIKSLDV